MQELNYFTLQAPSGEPDSTALFTVGLPLKKGQFYPLQALECCRSDNQEVKAGITPTGFWPDNSIKWIQVCGETTNEALNSAVFRIAESSHSVGLIRQKTPEVVKAGEYLSLATQQSTLKILTDKLFSGSICIADQVYDFHFSYDFDAPFEQLVPSLKDWHYTPVYYDSAAEEASCIELTLSYVMSPSSPDILPLEFTVNLKYFTHFGFADLRTTLCNPNPADHNAGTWDLGEEKSVLIKDFTFTVTAQDNNVILKPEHKEDLHTYVVQTECLLWQRSSSGKHWDSPNHVNRYRQTGINEHLTVVDINGVREETSIRLCPAASLQKGHHTLCFTPQKFWQNFPTALSAVPGEVRWHLFRAEDKQPVELQPGEQKSHGSVLSFADQKHHYLRATASLNTDWVAQCQVIPWFSTALHNDPLQQIVELGQVGEQNFFAKREQIDEYGWRHFGDLYADHETAGYEGKDLFPSHYNNQYDPLYGFLKQWLLTGDMRWKELADDLAQHIIDIDIYHCDTDKPEYNNGLFWHTDHYLPAETATHRTYSRYHKSDAYQDHAGGGGPGGQHCYTSGLQLYYFLTGNVQAKKAVLGLAEWITQVYEGDGTLFGLLLQFKNRHRRDLKQVASGSYPFDRGTANYMVALMDSYELTGNSRLLDNVAFIIRQTLSPQDDIENDRDLANVEECWFYTVFLQAVCRYLTIQQTVGITPDYSYARACLLHYAMWMADNEYPYLEKPDILEYPNQTWSAQDLRKVHVLEVAAIYADDDRAPKFKQKARQLKQYIVTALTQSEEREYTRILALTMQNYGVDSVLTATSELPPVIIPPVTVYPRIAGWPAEIMRVLKQFSPQHEWRQLQKRIPKLRGTKGN